MILIVLVMMFYAMIKMITFKFQHLKHKTKREREGEREREGGGGLSAYRTYSANRDLDQKGGGDSPVVRAPDS